MEESFAMPLALLALAVGAFGIGTTEFVIVGLLPDVASNVGVSIPAAGLLVTGYALGVVVGAPVMTVLGHRLPRKTMLALLMGFFIAGNLLCALAGSYTLLMIGRLVAALAHGAFFGIGSVVAAGLVPFHRKAAAISLMFTGLTVANVIGVPAGTFIGQHFGWRSTFACVTVFGLVALAGILALVPSRTDAPTTDLRSEFAVFRNTRVWLALATTALGFGSVFASFTFLAPMMTDLAGFSSGAVSWLLVLFGVGLCVGNLFGGRAADRALMPSLYVILAALTVVLLAFMVTSRYPIPAAVTIAVFGAVGFATVAPLQTRVLQQASGAPSLASAANIAAFNLGNAVGAALSGLALDHHLGYWSPNAIGACLAAGALTLAVISGRMDRRSAAGPERGTPLPARPAQLAG